MPPNERVYTGDLVILAVMVAGQFWLAWAFFHAGKKRLPRPVFYLTAIVLGLLWGVCLLGTFLNASHSTALPSVFRGTVSAVELLWTFISALGIVVFLIYRLICRKVMRRVPQADFNSRRNLIRGAAVAALAAPVAAVGYGALIERTRFQVRQVEFPIPDLHPDLDGIRVAQISDIHASAYLSVREVGRVVDMTNELNPHLTLVTGDLISDVGDPLDATIAELARLRAEAGVLGCLGNHEMYARCEAYATEQAKRRGIQILRRGSRQLQWGQGTLNVAGVDFQPFRHKEKYLAGAEKLIRPGVSNLLLSHNPDVFPAAVRMGYDAVVGGHTHAGQVTVEIMNQTLNFARFFTPFVAGLYRMNGRSCYVTAGIGTIGAPVRIGAPPEITLLRLRRA